MSKTKKPQRSQAVHWVFTDNGPMDGQRRTKAQWEEYLTDPGISGKVQYLVVGMEKAPLTGQLHGQGYLQLKDKARMAQVKSLLQADWLHLEVKVKRSKPEQCITYCKKDGDWMEWGEPKGGQGTRNDIIGGVQILKDGGTMHDLIMKCPEVFVKYSGGMLKVKAILQNHSLPAIREVKTYWLWGRTGSGKTMSVVKHEGKNLFKLQAYELKNFWWCGYEGETAILIDEFTSSCCNIVRMTALLDVYKMKLPVKNGHAYAQWNTVYVTSNLQYPEEVYPGAHPEHRAALFRRISKSIEFTKPAKEQTPPIFETDDVLESDGEDEEKTYGPFPLTYPPAGTPVISHTKPPLLRCNGFIFDPATE